MWGAWPRKFVAIGGVVLFIWLLRYFLLGLAVIIGLGLWVLH